LAGKAKIRSAVKIDRDGKDFFPCPQRTVKRKTWAKNQLQPTFVFNRERLKFGTECNPLLRFSENTAIFNLYHTSAKKISLEPSTP